jgi:hypothetical protein
MDPNDLSSSPFEPAEPPESADRLSASARGWHRIQLAVLGFIGFCSVMWASGDPSGPGWAQQVAAVFVVLALILASVAIYIVGRVAFPFYSQAASAIDDATNQDRARRLRSGIILTYVAVGILVIGTLTAWWPKPADTGALELHGAAGEVWCGELIDGPLGTVALDTRDDGPVALPLDRIAAVRPVSEC